MLSWAPSLLAFLLPTLLVQGEGKGPVGEHVDPAGHQQRRVRTLDPPKGEGRGPLSGSCCRKAGGLTTDEHQRITQHVAPG